MTSGNALKALIVGIVPLASGMTAGAELFDDFEDGQLLDGNPVVWGPACSWSNTSWRILDGDLHIQNATTTNASMPTAEVFDGDVTLETELKFVGTGGKVRLGLHSFCLPVNAYLAGLDTRGEVRFNRWVDNVNAQGLAIASLPFAYDPGAWHRLRFDRIGDRLELRVWPTDDEMPKEPHLWLEDTSLPRGQINLGFIKDNATDWVAFRWVRITTPEPDCNGNGVGDGEDIRSGTSRDADGNQVPDECDSELAVSTEEIDFGEVHVGESAERIVEIENLGQATLRVTRIRVLQSAFELGADFEPFDLDSGESASIGVRFRPDAAGEKRASLLVQSDATKNPTVTVTMVGTGTGPVPRFLRGDCNDDGTVDISDAVCALNWLFLGSEAPGCVAALNTNGDTGADISDATYLLNHLFLGGPAPVAPFPRCGPGTLPTDEEPCEALCSEEL